MSTTATTLYALAAITVLLAMLIVVVTKPKGLPEGLVGFVGAGVLVAIGATSPASAWNRIQGMLPTVLFLGFCLILAGLCEREGLFSYLGSRIGEMAHGSARLLFLLVFVMAALVTAALSLDTTVLLLTPVIMEVSLRTRVDYRPNTYAACHLANTASLLLPVSNLTNLLAMNTTHMDVLGFARLMALPWLAAVIVEFPALRVFFRSSLRGTSEGTEHGAARGDGLHDLTGDVDHRPPSDARQRAGDTRQRDSGQRDTRQRDDPSTHAPVLALVVVSLTLLGFLISGRVGLNPFWFAAAGCVPLVIGRIARAGSGLHADIHSGIHRELTDAARHANISFLIFVLSLAVVVSALADNGLARLIDPLFCAPPGITRLLLVAALSALAANAFNNLPAAMLLIPLAAAHGPLFTLAVLIGVDIGPNLTYAGSLANILWRRILRESGRRTELLTFSAVGLISVPLCIVAATATLWLVS